MKVKKQIVLLAQTIIQKGPVTTLFLFVCLYVGLAQENRKIDSLETILESNISDKHRMDVHTNIAILYEDPDSAAITFHVRKAIALADKIAYPKGRLDALNPLGNLYVELAYYDKAELVFQKMLAAADSITYKKGMASALRGLGRIDFDTGELEKARHHLILSTEILKGQDNKLQLAKNYNLLGHISDFSGSAGNALEYYLLALDLYKSLNDDRGRAAIFSNIGIIYKNQNDLEKAEDYSKRSLKINKRIGHKKGLGNNYSILALIEYIKENYQKAQEYNIKALDIRQELGQRKKIAISLIRVARGLTQAGNYDSALKYLSKAKTLCEELGLKNKKAAIYNEMGQIYFQKGELTKAKVHVEEALQAAQADKLLEDLKKASLLLSQIEKNLGNYQQAYNAHILFKRTEDTLHSVNITKKIAYLETTRRINSKRDSLQLNNNKEMQEFQERQKASEHKLIIIYHIAGTVLFILLTFFVFRYKMAQRKKVQILRNEISRDLHQEIGTTLSNISLYGNVANMSIKKSPEKALGLIKLINISAAKTMEAMNDIVWAVKSDNDTIQYLINRMRSYANEVQSKTHWKIDFKYSDEILKKNLNMVQRKNCYLIFKEVLQNSHEYSKGDTIKVCFKTKSKVTEITIEDNGVGFDAKKLFQEQQIGHSKGLAYMQSKAKEIKGNLKIKAIAGQGTKVTINF